MPFINIIFRYSLLFLSLVMTACSQVSLGLVNFPTHFDGVKVSRNVSFGPDAWQGLDIYAPSKISGNEKLPVVVFYYGGRWTDGSKNDYKFVGSALAKQGYVTVIPDYRKYPDVKFPTFIEDAAQSLTWVSDHIGEYGGDTGSIYVAGHSAGAHIGALVVADARYLQALGKNRSDVVRGFIGLAGPYDFEPHEDDLKLMFGPPDQYPQMQVTTFVDGRQPPMLLLWGDRDEYVGQFNMDRLAGGISKKGGCVKTKIYPGLDHIWILGDLSWMGRDKFGILEEWVSFMKDNHCKDKL